MTTYYWQDWLLGAGIVIFVISAGNAASYGDGLGGIISAAIAAVCAYYYAKRIPIRNGPPKAAWAPTSVVPPPQPPQ